MYESNRVLTKKVEGGVRATLALDRDDLGRERHGCLLVGGGSYTWRVCFDVDRAGWGTLALCVGSRLESLWLGLELWMQTESEYLVLA